MESAMRKAMFILPLPVLFSGVFSFRASGQELFDVPLRINLGGVETVDSLGRTWLGDGPGAGDPLNIRPDDAGGANAIENWSLGAFQPDSLTALGFDPFHPGDSYIFNTIRYDDGANPPDYILELPIPNGSYLVNLYFNESCCPNRHFKLQIQDEIVDDNVSYVDYANPPGLGKVGRLSFQGVPVQDQVLRIGLLPCPECPCPECAAGAIPDINALIDALEVLSGPGCDNQGLDFNCSYDTGTGEVTGTWKAFPGADAYRVLKNGDPLGADFPDDATSFLDTDPGNEGPIPTYELQALDGDVPAASCSCSVKTFTCPGDLTCWVTPGTSEVALSWTAPAGEAFITGYEVFRNGESIGSLSADAISFEDDSPQRFVDYQVVPQSDPPDLCSSLSCSVIVEGAPFEIPLRINMGGAETVDSKGRVWLGDGPGNGDPLGIRLDDLGGFNFGENWFVQNFKPDSLPPLGFDPDHPGDSYIFNTIRWDDGGDGIDFRLEIALPEGEYLVRLYFNEGCCTTRHFKLELQGEIVDEDVSYLDYDVANPGVGRLGRLSYPDVAITDGFLRVALLPCPDCVGVGDINAIIDALEVLPNDCSDPGFRQCPGNLSCITDPGGNVELSWDPPLCMEVTGYEIRRDGEVIDTLDAEELSYFDVMEKRVALYELAPLVAEGVDPCPPVPCLAVVEDLDFQVPLRINMGGLTKIDSRGRIWWGDGPGPGDPLGIRPDDLGGSNTNENWCTLNLLNQADSLRAFGFDPSHPGDIYIFDSLRWDPGADLIDFRLEIPLENGTYQVNLYFAECHNPGRHFKVEIQGTLVDEDLSFEDIDPLKDAYGRVGRHTFDGIQVDDGILRLAFLPCPDCIDTDPLDINAIINAIEILPAETPLASCPRSLVTSLEPTGEVRVEWWEGENVQLTGYDLYRDGEKIQTLQPDAFDYFDMPSLCKRITVYELVPLSDDPDFLCPDLRMRSILVNPECPFEAPLRINMGGVEAFDSRGDLWLGDGPGAGDPLEIRPDDAGGANFAENWSLGAFQPDSLEALGFDPSHPADKYIFNTIRWDDNAAPGDFILEIPMNNGQYEVSLYFNEGCCPTRHFKISMQGEIVDDDVSYLDYDPANPATGRVGRLTFEGIVVAAGILQIGLLSCPECPGVGDFNPIIDALEIILTGGPPPLPPENLQAAEGDQQVDLSWDAVAGAVGYNVFRSPNSGGPYTQVNQELVTETSYTDSGLENGTQYCYVVRAVSADALESLNSGEVCATPAGAGEVFRRGDADGNGSVELTDVIRALTWQFVGGVELPCQDAADIDDDGAITLTDAIRSLNYQFVGVPGTMPEAPGPFDCGPDGIEDGLPDCVYTCE